jgi:hypothetical protein
LVGVGVSVFCLVVEGWQPQDFWFCFLLVMDTVTSVATVLDTAEEELV